MCGTNIVYTYVCAGVFACMCAWYVCVHVCVKHMCLCGSVYMQRLEVNAGIFYCTSSTILPSVLRYGPSFRVHCFMETCLPMSPRVL